MDEGLSDGEGRPGQANAAATADVSGEDGEAERERRRAAVADRLAALTDNFISHISAAAACFPPSLGWVVRSLHDLLRKGSSCTADQVGAPPSGSRRWEEWRHDSASLHLQSFFVVADLLCSSVIRLLHSTYLCVPKREQIGSARGGCFILLIRSLAINGTLMCSAPVLTLALLRVLLR